MELGYEKVLSSYMPNDKRIIYAVYIINLIFMKLILTLHVLPIIKCNVVHFPKKNNSDAQKHLR